MPSYHLASHTMCMHMPAWGLAEHCGALIDVSDPLVPLQVHQRGC